MNNYSEEYKALLADVARLEEQVEHQDKDITQLINVVHDLLKLLKDIPQTSAADLRYRTADNRFAACVRKIQTTHGFYADE